MAKNMNKIIDDLGIREQVGNLPYYNGKKDIDFEKDGLPVIPSGITTLDSQDPALKGNYIFVNKEKLDEVKQLAGIPDEVFQNPENKRAFAKPLEQENFDEMSTREKVVRCLLNPLPKKAVRAMNDSGQMKEINEFICENASNIPVFLGDQLVIKEGESIAVKNSVILIFRRLVMEGNAKMDLTDNYYIKIVACTLS